MAVFSDVENFNTPITDLLEGNDASILTSSARKLLEGDLYALAWALLHKLSLSGQGGAQGKLTG